MFVLDIETLDTFETSAILSIGAVYFDHLKEFEIEDLRRDSFFVKMDAKEQLKNGRTMSKGTVEFWEKQDRATQIRNYFPTPIDVGSREALTSFGIWFNKWNPGRAPVVWTRGGLDYSCLAHLAQQLGTKLPFSYWCVRDVRTAVDILSGSSNGYCDTTKSLNKLKKHDPVDDCIIDAMQLKYFKEAT